MQFRVLRALALGSALLGPAVAQMAALEKAVRNAEAKSVRTGVAICDGDGRVLYRHRASEAFAPASNMKLLTAVGVLHGLGPGFQFRSAFHVVDGELLVHASGDPNFIAGTESDPVIVFANLARELRTRNLSELRGVRLLPGTFTGPNTPTTWPQDQLHTYYCAPTGGFVLEQGTFIVSLERSRGNNAQVKLVAPPSGYPIRGAIQQLATKRGAVYGAIDQGDGIRMRGKFYRKSPRVEITTAMKDPSSWYRDTLINQLVKGGIRIRSSAPSSSPGLIYTHESGLAPALRRMLEESSNFAAEQCLRVLGAKERKSGTLASGRDALRHAITGLVGRMPEGVVITDGSGLSKQNRITPGLLVVAMFRSFTGTDGALLRDSLPVAGQTGTLKSRFRGSNLEGRVRAKTGWIRGASSLSGLLTTPGSKPYWFSILMNYDRSRNGLNKDLKRIQEDIVIAIDGMRAN